VSANAGKYRLDRNRIVLAGDSAGAQLAAQLANMATSPAYAKALGMTPALAPSQLIGVVLFCGPYDAKYTMQPGQVKPSWFMQTVMWSYMGRKDFWNHPDIGAFSVARHVTPAFPPAFVSVGNDDPLQVHSYAMAEGLRRAGVRVDTLFWPKDHVPALPHEYQFNLDNAEGKEALRRLEAYLSTL
jgi:acetyl esterase/lipase